jgi:hypothetical protein
MFDRKRSKTVTVSLTVRKEHQVLLLGALKSSGHVHQFKKIKHQTAQGCAEHGSVTQFGQSWAAQPRVDVCVAQRPSGSVSKTPGTSLETMDSVDNSFRMQSVS